MHTLFTDQGSTEDMNHCTPHQLMPKVPTCELLYKRFHDTLLSKLATAFETHSGAILACSVIVEIRLFAILEL